MTKYRHTDNQNSRYLQVSDCGYESLLILNTVIHLFFNWPYFCKVPTANTCIFLRLYFYNNFFLLNPFHENFVAGALFLHLCDHANLHKIMSSQIKGILQYFWLKCTSKYMLGFIQTIPYWSHSIFREMQIMITLNNSKYLIICFIFPNNCNYTCPLQINLIMKIQHMYCKRGYFRLEKILQNRDWKIHFGVIFMIPMCFLGRFH